MLIRLLKIARRVKAFILCGIARTSMIGLSRGPHITRYTMYKHLQETNPCKEPGLKVLSISHSDKLCHILGFREEDITTGNYPDVNILALPYADHEFDIVVNDQVLEHVEGPPEQAVRETYRVLKPGGVVITTTCFINPLHAAPSDFWRFTPDALKLLHKEFSEIIDVGGWGNEWVWYLTRLGLRYDGIPNARWHPLHFVATWNDDEWAVSVWIVARK